MLAGVCNVQRTREVRKGWIFASSQSCRVDRSREQPGVSQRREWSLKFVFIERCRPMTKFEKTVPLRMRADGNASRQWRIYSLISNFCSSAQTFAQVGFYLPARFLSAGPGSWQDLRHGKTGVEGLHEDPGAPDPANTADSGLQPGLFSSPQKEWKGVGAVQWWVMGYQQTRDSHRSVNRLASNQR